MIHHYHLPPNAFAEIDGSDFSLRKLQSIIIGPSRFRNHCLAKKTDAHYIKTSHAGFSDVQVMTMVPGGRWIVTGHSDGHLNVWDAHRGMSLREAVDLGGAVHVMLVQRTDDSRGVRILTESTEPGTTYVILQCCGTHSHRCLNSSSDQDRVCLTEVPLDDLGVSASHTLSWLNFEGNDTIALEGQYAVTERNHLTRIWDWRLNLYGAYRWDIATDWDQLQAPVGGRVSTAMNILSLYQHL